MLSRRIHANAMAQSDARGRPGLGTTIAESGVCTRGLPAMPSTRYGAAKGHACCPVWPCGQRSKSISGLQADLYRPIRVGT